MTSIYRNSPLCAGMTGATASMSGTSLTEVGDVVLSVARTHKFSAVLGITQGNRKEVTDFMVAQSESQAAWEAFLGDLCRGGLCGENACLIVTDGSAGLVAALDLIYPRVLHQRSWAHKTRNVLNCVKKSDHQTVKKDLHI